MAGNNIFGAKTFLMLIAFCSFEKPSAPAMTSPAHSLSSDLCGSSTLDLKSAIASVVYHNNGANRKGQGKFYEA